MKITIPLIAFETKARPLYLSPSCGACEKKDIKNSLQVALSVCRADNYNIKKVVLWNHVNCFEDVDEMIRNKILFACGTDPFSEKIAAARARWLDAVIYR